MKVWNTIVKILVALAAIAGAVYVAATYGDKIVAWCKKMLGALPSSKCCDCGEGECACDCESVEEAPAQEPAAEEVQEAAPAEEAAVVAEENDFEG